MEEKYKVIDVGYNSPESLQSILNDYAYQGYDVIHCVESLPPLKKVMIILEKKRQVIPFNLSPYCTRLESTNIP